MHWLFSTDSIGGFDLTFHWRLSPDSNTRDGITRVFRAFGAIKWDDFLPFTGV